MRLHRLTLRDVKGVRERTVDLPEHGIVVLEGPNEIGKSTMLEAFDALLTFKATSRAAEVRALQPVDRDVAPYVEAELTVGGTRLRFAKRWLRQPATTLDVLGTRPEQLTGDAAQTRVDGLLKQHLDRTLYDALRLTQSGDGTLAPLASSALLTQALDAAAGAQLHAAGADAILDSVEAEYRLYYTATGRPTGDYRQAMSRFTQAQQDVADAHLRLEEGRQLLDRQETARERAAACGTRLAAAAELLEQAEQIAAAAEDVVRRHDAALDQHAQALELRRAAVRAHEERARLVAGADSLSATLEAARAARREDVARAEELHEVLLGAQSGVEEAGVGVVAASEALDAAREDLDHLGEVRELVAREALLARTEELVAALCRARGALPQRGVTREAARRVRGLHDRLDATVTQHELLSPVLEVDSTAASVDVVAADGTRLSVPPGGSREVSLGEDTCVEIPGQVRLRVRLRQDARGRADEIHRLRSELAAALADLDVEHLDDVEALADRTEEAHSAVREALRDVDALLLPVGPGLAAEAAGGAVPAALVARVDQARARVEAHRARSGRPAPDDEPQARTAADRAATQLRQARADQRRAAEVLAVARSEAAAVTTRLDRAEGSIAAHETRLEELTTELAAAREESSDTALVALVEERKTTVTTAEEALAASAAELAAADVEAARVGLVRALDQHRQATREREQALAELHTVGGQLEMAAGEGRQELYELASDELDDAERELQGVDRRARAARHLRSTLTEHRDAAHRTYVLPYTQALEELGRRVFGAGFAVTVGEDLALAARTLDGVTVPYAGLSGGAKEQLGILARLAVARLVDPVHGVPVVIDDALGYSDPERLRQMGEVLGTTVGDGDEVQVILLTCTPERYAAIPHARTVRLTA
ncbi:AAA family ATPase [Ornithinimicrobium avium]|uniref:YhaN AAA domain-containing protein n=1 Tax=Ornithinimicrobium avium TaxID=2283195 RepID=A0A345NQD2_9MICO|nr:AAA family ATPase [Ornithinimicrobium avium]AXH97240.1 hypothetical protein DV701_14960 [Ornithinimicrobium avium]